MPAPALRQLCLVGLALATTALAARADWPQWRGPNRDGKVVDATIRTDWEANPPQHLWTVQDVGYGYGSVAHVGDMLYTTGYTDDAEVISAVNLKTKKIVWQTPIGEIVEQGNADWKGSRSTPTIVGDRIYAVASQGKAICLETKSGKMVWQKTFADEFGSGKQSWGYAESPLVDGDLVLCTPGSDKALMVAFNRHDGAEKWRLPYPELGEIGKKEAGYSSIVISNGAGVKQYVQMTGKGLIGVRAEDGELLWNYNKVANDVAVIPTPIIAGDLVFASSGYQAGAALVRLSPDGDGVKADEVYFLEARVFQNHHGQMILHEGHIYAGRGQGRGFPVCVELESGELAWGEGERGPGSGSAAVTFVDGHLIFRYQDGTVALIEATPEEYRLKGTFTPEFTEGPNWAHAVVGDGILFLRQKGQIMAFDVSKKN